MLLRAYRVTDRLGVVILKGSVALGAVTLDGLTIARKGATGVAVRIFQVIAVLAGFLFGIVRGAFRLIFSAGGRAGNTAIRRAGTAAGDAMARRATRAAARAELKANIAEDPLRVQNRVLSALVVVLGVAVLAVILWATDPSRNQPSLAGAAAPLPAQPGQSSLQPLPTDQPLAPTAQPVVATLPALPTPVPTATALPEILSARGSLAYVVREKAQTDIWAIPVGSRSALRITNSPADERDPAWSPDGSKLAYASRQDGNWEIYIYDVASGESTRMTYDLSFQGGPTWSPDGEWLAYESYQGNNLDIYVMRVDGTQAPMRLTDHSAPDFSPAWSPDGRTIAFVSWRDGNQDIMLFSLDDPRDDAVVNLTNTPLRHEDYPAWSPDGTLIAYSALDEGVEKVFVKSVTDPDAPAQVIGRGRAPTWSPDGASLVYAVDSLDSTHLVAGPFAGSGVATEIIPVPRGSTSPVWTAAPLPQTLVNSGGLPPASNEPLYVEHESEPRTDPPYRLSVLNNVSAPNAVLSERVNDSFAALRERTLEAVGWDFLGRLEDAFWQIDRPPQPGEERRNWLMTGRGFAINRNLIVGFPAPIEVVREDLDVNTYWRVFVRVADEYQSGQLGEPLRRMPWDFASRNQGDVEAYEQGGRLRAEMPSGYYVDLTQLAADYGWERVPAGSDWRRNFNSTNYWLFNKRDGLTWYEAMRELYTEAQLGGFAPRPSTAAPAPDISALTQLPPASTEATTEETP
ncbi:MAG: hypothetical protein DIU68_015585 [Chloroflexota bacterium]